MDNIWYIVLLIVGYLLLNKTNLIENFPYGQPQWLKPWMIWNQPTRFPKLFYDIRGDPNIVYRSHIFGGLVPYGYVFGPYVYDAQGNLIYDSNKPQYIA
jgi:hypothetical protein